MLPPVSLLGRLVALRTVVQTLNPQESITSGVSRCDLCPLISAPLTLWVSLCPLRVSVWSLTVPESLRPGET